MAQLDGFFRILVVGEQQISAASDSIASKVEKAV
jgi:hypothetical protein